MDNGDKYTTETKRVRHKVLIIALGLLDINKSYPCLVN